MKNKLNTALLVSTIFLATVALGQSNGTESQKTGDPKKTAKTYFDLMVNVVSTNINYGGFNSALTDYKKSLNGIQAGVSLQAGITPGFSLVSEFYFLRKGGKITANNPYSTSESSLRLNTLELPVLARFHIGKLYLNAGTSIAYNLSGSRKVDELSTKLSFDHSTEGFKRFEAGLQIGGGIEFPFKQRRIALDIRYNYGLTNIAYNGEIRNRAIMISVHFSRQWKTNPLAAK
jgi:hypothetical protein